jgi:hypothetical protein
MTVNECATGFMPKDQYVQLPAYIGQPVWVVHAWSWPSGYHVDVTEGKVSMLQQKVDKSWKFRVTITSSVMDFAVADIGKHIFFSEFEAIEEMYRLEKELD